MASHQISIKQDVYNRLKNAKRTHESFSDIINRLLDLESNVDKVLESYGKAKSKDTQEERIILETYEKTRLELRKQMKNRLSNME